MIKIVKHCNVCNKEFNAGRIDAKFCSSACKQKAYYSRLKLQNEMNVENENKENEKLVADRIKQQTELAIKLKELEELEKLRLEKQKIIDKENIEKISEIFKQFERDNNTMKINYANKQLKEWLIELLLFNKAERVLLLSVKILLEQISRNDFDNLPSDFKYHTFLRTTLLPKVNHWLNIMRKSKDRYVNFDLPLNFKTKLEKIIEEIY